MGLHDPKVPGPPSMDSGPYDPEFLEWYRTEAPDAFRRRWKNEILPWYRQLEYHQREKHLAANESLHDAFGAAQSQLRTVRRFLRWIVGCVSAQLLGLIWPDVVELRVIALGAAVLTLSMLFDIFVRMPRIERYDPGFELRSPPGKLQEWESVFEREGYDYDGEPEDSDHPL